MKSENNIHIAFAEDHVVVRKGIISLLNPLGGITVDIEADNGEELLERIESADRFPDICIIDVSMPVMDGYTALTEIKKRWPGMKSLILTAFHPEPIIIRMIKAGANGFLLKSCSPEEVKSALQIIYETGYYYSDTASYKIFQMVLNDPLKHQYFTDTELELLRYSSSDLSYAEIAARLGTTFKSVEGTRNRLFNKLRVSSRVSLALFAFQCGLAPADLETKEN